MREGQNQRAWVSSLSLWCVKGVGEYWWWNSSWWKEIRGQLKTGHSTTSLRGGSGAFNFFLLYIPEIQFINWISNNLNLHPLKWLWTPSLPNKDKRDLARLDSRRRISSWLGEAPAIYEMTLYRIQGIQNALLFKTLEYEITSCRFLLPLGPVTCQTMGNLPAWVSAHGIAEVNDIKRITRAWLGWRSGEIIFLSYFILAVVTCVCWRLGWESSTSIAQGAATAPFQHWFLFQKKRYSGVTSVHPVFLTTHNGVSKHHKIMAYKARRERWNWPVIGKWFTKGSLSHSWSIRLLILTLSTMAHSNYEANREVKLLRWRGSSNIFQRLKLSTWIRGASCPQWYSRFSLTTRDISPVFSWRYSGCKSDSCDICN